MCWDLSTDLLRYFCYKESGIHPYSLLNRFHIGWPLWFCWTQRWRTAWKCGRRWLISPRLCWSYIITTPWRVSPLDSIIHVSSVSRRLARSCFPVPKMYDPPFSAFQFSNLLYRHLQTLRRSWILPSHSKHTALLFVTPHPLVCHISEYI